MLGADRGDPGDEKKEDETIYDWSLGVYNEEAFLRALRLEKYYRTLEGYQNQSVSRRGNNPCFRSDGTILEEGAIRIDNIIAQPGQSTLFQVTFLGSKSWEIKEDLVA